MIGLDQAARQIAAAWNLALNRPNWTRDLDRSVDGVFRSFWAFAFAAPLHVIGFYAARRAARALPELAAEPLADAAFAAALPAQMVGFFADWCVSLAALLLIARATGAARRAADIVAGYNWLQVPIAAIQVAPLIAMSLTNQPQLAGLLFVPALAAVVALFWGFLRRTLATDAGSTIGVIILLTLIGLIVQSAAAALALGAIRLFL